MSDEQFRPMYERADAERKILLRLSVRLVERLHREHTPEGENVAGWQTCADAHCRDARETLLKLRGGGGS